MHPVVPEAQETPGVLSSLNQNLSSYLLERTPELGLCPWRSKGSQHTPTLSQQASPSPHSHQKMTGGWSLCAAGKQPPLALCCQPETNFPFHASLKCRLYGHLDHPRVVRATVGLVPKGTSAMGLENTGGANEGGLDGSQSSSPVGSPTGMCSLSSRCLRADLTFSLDRLTHLPASTEPKELELPAWAETLQEVNHVSHLSFPPSTGMTHVLRPTPGVTFQIKQDHAFWGWLSLPLYQMVQYSRPSVSMASHPQIQPSGSGFGIHVYGEFTVWSLKGRDQVSLTLVALEPDIQMYSTNWDSHGNFQPLPL